jgi:hypothetical protein
MAVNMITDHRIMQQAAEALQQAHAEPMPFDYMDKSEVCIVLIHQGMIHYRTALWLDKQRIEGVRVVCHTEQALLSHPNGMVEKYLNCAAARNNARIKALESSSKWFMFLDADVIPPVNAIDHFLMQKTPVRGGWYPIKNVKNRWVAGRWVADNKFYNYEQPNRIEYYPSDTLPAGCCMMDRDIVELIEFNHGTDIFYTDYTTNQKAVLGECGMFGNMLHELGETTWMNPAVICEHEFFS